jgi:hypothetical protein
LQSLPSTARAQLRGRAQRANNLREINSEPLPLVAHLEGDAFTARHVVLEQHWPQHAWIARDRRVADKLLAELPQHFTFVRGARIQSRASHDRARENERVPHRFERLAPTVNEAGTML